eukprot:TRINITY_DN41301_c0_g1_i1.p1 TRINITY_DN41301_c0_g1~~TRINITY_DN41301_c0_g1_i1.p1  ORF type:complete len:121 (+),score=26.85 TRINITY_DN41301_c0_g1_i1:182-544(+)
MVRSTLMLTIFIFVLCEHDIHATTCELCSHGDSHDESASSSVQDMNQYLAAKPESDQTGKQADDADEEAPDYVNDGMHQDVRLVASFALGIAFMYVLEVLKGNAPRGSRNSKFELYPYVL